MATHKKGSMHAASKKFAKQSESVLKDRVRIMKAGRDYPLSETPDPSKSFASGERGALRASKQADKLKEKSAMKSKVADIKYTKAMREMSGKEARTAIRDERAKYRSAKKKINMGYKDYM